jgi:hypothetical protein
MVWVRCRNWQILARLSSEGLERQTAIILKLKARMSEQHAALERHIGEADRSVAAHAAESSALVRHSQLSYNAQLAYDVQRTAGMQTLCVGCSVQVLHAIHADNALAVAWPVVQCGAPQ